MHSMDYGSAEAAEGSGEAGDQLASFSPDDILNLGQGEEPGTQEVYTNCFIIGVDLSVSILQAGIRRRCSMNRRWRWRETSRLPAPRRTRC